MTDPDLTTNGLFAIETIEASKHADDISKHFGDFIKSHGFKSFAMCQLVNPGLLKDSGSQIFLANWNPAWGIHWWESGYMQHDPIIQYLLKTKAPFSWDAAYRHASRQGKKILDEAGEYGVKKGISFPVLMEPEPMGCVSLCAYKIPFDPDILNMVELVATHAYMHLIRLSSVDIKFRRDHLSKRETEVINCVALGKSNWEIAQILGLSEHSVKDYLKNTAKKLDTVNRAHAVSQAIKQGLIIP